MAFLASTPSMAMTVISPHFTSVPHVVSMPHVTVTPHVSPSPTPRVTVTHHEVYVAPAIKAPLRANKPLEKESNTKVLPFIAVPLNHSSDGLYKCSDYTYAHQHQKECDASRKNK